MDITGTINNKNELTGEVSIGGTVVTPGADGLSAYEIWLEEGNIGTEADFLESLKGEKGETGDSVFVSKVTESTADGGSNVVEFSDGKSLSIKNGSKGSAGYTPQKNVDYFDGKDGASVTVSKVSESNTDGGSNVVTFSDGKTLTVKNGNRGSKGDSGVSPTHSWNGTVLSITSASGTSSSDLKGERGEQGLPGKDGTGVTILGSYDTEEELKSARPTGNAGDAYMINGNLYVWSATTNKWENVGNIKGETGADGFSPTVSVNKENGVTTVEIIDKSGVKTAIINDGAKGDTGYTPQKNVDYFDGKDGVSPAVNVSKTDGTTTIEITDKNGTKTATINDGADGESISIAEYEAGDDYTTVEFSNGDVIQIPSGVGIRNIRLKTGGDVGNTYTVELTNGQNYEFTAPAGPAGNDGISATHSWNGTVLSITSASGTSSTDLKGNAGKDGTSVTVSSVSESTADGGSNVISFSDGKTLTVKNGSKGSDGGDGVSPTLTVSKSGKVTTIQITDKNGTKTATINDGNDGKDGTNATTTAVATTSANGLMSSSDKSKLNGIANNANNYSHPTYTAKSSGIYKITVDSSGHVSAATPATTETWTFTLANGSTVTKKVVLG